MIMCAKYSLPHQPDGRIFPIDYSRELDDTIFKITHTHTHTHTVYIDDVYNITAYMGQMIGKSCSCI